MVDMIIDHDKKKGHSLLDHGATHSFVAYKFVNILNMPKCKLKKKKELVVSTPLREVVEVDDV
jgi:hypothetical protein